MSWNNEEEILHCLQFMAQKKHHHTIRASLMPENMQELFHIL